MTSSGPRADATALIPHRPPILVVDAVLQASERVAVTERIVRDTDEWEGCLIEGLAQTAAVLAASAGGTPKPALLVGLRGLSLSRLPRAGERIEFHVELVRRLAPLVLVQGTARAGDEVLAEGELKFFVGDGS